VLAVVVSALGSILPGWDALGWWNVLVIVGAVVAIAALVIQDRQAGAVVVPFASDNWQRKAEHDSPGATAHELIISYARHRRRHPVTEVFQREPGGGLAVTLVDVQLRGRDVVLRIGLPGFDGEARIS
jgi:hypothetical protein